MNNRYFRQDAMLEANGMASRYEIALALLATRRSVALTQRQLAVRASWKTQFVCRLESLEGRLPNLTTLIRYAKACDVDLRLLFSQASAGGFSVVRDITLRGSPEVSSAETLTGCFLDYAAVPVDIPVATPWID